MQDQSVSQEDNQQQQVSNDKLAEAVQIAEFNFEILLLMIKDAIMKKKMSARNMMRALLTAINYNITDKEYVKLTTKDEAELAGLIAKALDTRTILQAEKLRKQGE